MAVQNWAGTLNTNEVYSDLFNTIIRHIVFSNNIDDTKASLLDMARVDGGLYGDQVLYTSFDILGTREWLGDAEAANLLNVKRNTTEITQALELDNFRQIDLTLDDYLSKRAWADASAFGQFNSALLQSMRDSKRIFESTTYNTFIGTHTSSPDSPSYATQNPTITLQKEEAGETPEQTEARNRIDAQTIAQFTSDLLVKLEYPSRDFNDYGFIRSLNSEDLIAVWSSDWMSKITKVDTPTIYNRDSALADKFGEYTLPGFLFGDVNASSGTTPASNTSIRSLIEVTISDKVYFPGDLLPGSYNYEANTTYTVDPSVVYVLMHKESVPYLEGFQASTEFNNARALNQNHYITWGYGTLNHLYQYPFIRVKAVPAS